MAGGGFEFHNSDEYKKVGSKVKVDWVCGHSERLATIYGLIYNGYGMPPRMAKNLRVCADFHSLMRFVSKVTRRKIILRDTNRFHHFDDGSCSCKDYL